ncbi:MAG: leucine-rich repeat protein [Prevotella sp.]|nr:leucine-rich repeat protein [Prevotella sp.]
MLNIFDGCSNLKTLILPDNLKVIGKHAFAGSIYLTELVIPKNVELINEEASSALFGQQKITVLATTPPYVDDNTFSNYDVPLYVPEEAINDYQATNPWSKSITEQTITDAEQMQAE